MNFKELVKISSKLSLLEKKRLVGLIESEMYSDKIDSVRASIIEGNVACPHCESNAIYKHGTIKGRMRFRCKECKKTFNEQTGTSIQGIRKKEKWTRFIELTIESKSLRHICRELELSMQTVFDWRHKVLTSIEKVFTKQFEGIVEMDDAYFRFNQKGRKKNFIESKRRIKGKLNKRGLSNDQVSVLFTMDRQGTIGTDMLKLGKINLDSLNKLDVNRFHKESIICTDKDRSLMSWTKTFGFENKFINSSAKEYVKEGVFHVQHVNNFMQRFKEWLTSNFSSVATKYLHNYLSYFKMLMIIKESKEKVEEFLTFSLEDSNSNNRFDEIENNYQIFLGNDK